MPKNSESDFDHTFRIWSWILNPYRIGHKVATPIERWIKSNIIYRKKSLIDIVWSFTIKLALVFPQNFVKKNHIGVGLHRYLAIFSQNNQDHF